MRGFFYSAGTKDFQDKAGQRFICNDIFSAFSRYISVADLWNFNRRAAGDFGQFVYSGFVPFDPGDEN